MAEKKPKKVWDNHKVIGEVLKSDRTKLVVQLVTREGVKIVNVHEWYYKKSTAEWKPGFAGFSIPIAIPVDGEVKFRVNELVNLIASAVNQSNDFPLEDEENAVWSTK